MIKKNILFSAFAACPPLPDEKIHPGSEYSCAWNLIEALDATNKYKLTVLIGSSDGKFASFKNLKFSNLKNTKFEKVTLTKKGLFLLKCLNFLRIDPEYWLIWPILLKEWNKSAYKKAVNLKNINKYDLVHQASPGGFKNPGYLWKLNLPSYWGPVYGIYHLNLKMAMQQNFVYFLKCLLSNILNFLALRSKYVSLAAKNYRYICTGTIEAHDKFYKVFNRNTDIIYENALKNIDEVNKNINSKDASNYEILWCGSVDYRKNLKLFLDSLNGISQQLTAHIAGTGPNIKKMEAYYNKNIKESTCAKVIFHGHISQDKLFTIMKKSHALIFTTMAEGNTSAIFEAFERGLIPITVNEHGFKSSLSYNNGILINMDNKYKNIVNDFNLAIKKLNNISNRNVYYENIIKNTHNISWKKMLDKHFAVYDEY